jgi:hypothetical protein
MSLKIWARGDTVDHNDLNLNFSTLASIDLLNTNFLIWMASLPTTLPADSGVAWNNGGIPCVS